MSRVGTTNLQAHQKTQTLFCTATGDHPGLLAEKFRMHVTGMYFSTAGHPQGGPCQESRSARVVC